MGSKSGGEPDIKDSFLQRICHALDETPIMLANNLGIPYKEIEPLLDQRHLLAEIDRDEVWWLILDYTSKRLGHIMAVRTELNKRLQHDRKKRLLRHDRFNKFHKNNDV